MRVLNYPEQRTAPHEGQLRAGEHSDYDNLTICLIEDKPGGLQARSPDGAWVDVPAVAGSFVVNIGDFLMRWTNDRWKSTRHRVLNPPRAAEGRLSFCHFIEPNYDALIECLPTCSGPEQPAKYPPIAAGDYMLEKFASQASGEEWSDETAASSALRTPRRASPGDHLLSSRRPPLVDDRVRLRLWVRPLGLSADWRFRILDLMWRGLAGLERAGRTGLPSRAVVPFPTIRFV